MLENANLTPAPSDAAGLNKFVDVIKNMCGVDLESKKEMIKQRLANFCQANGISSFENLSSKVVVDRTLRQEILNLITTNETYFYRELAHLQASIYDAK